jgi:hypothetical protein
LIEAYHRKIRRRRSPRVEQRGSTSLLKERVKTNLNRLDALAMWSKGSGLS